MQTLIFITQRVFCILIVLFVSGCGIITKGISSEPFIRALDTEDNEKYSSQGNGIETPGLNLTINLENSLKTFEGIFFGIEIPMVPLYLNFEDEFYENPGDEKQLYAVSLHIQPRDSGYTFYPQNIMLTIDEKVFPITGIENKQIPESYLDLGNTTPDPQKLAFDASAVWDYKNTHYYHLYFRVETPSPKKNIQLDLSKALIHPSYENIPVIGFKQSSWGRSH